MFITWQYISSSEENTRSPLSCNSPDTEEKKTQTNKQTTTNLFGQTKQLIIISTLVNLSLPKEIN